MSHCCKDVDFAVVNRIWLTKFSLCNKKLELVLEYKRTSDTKPVLHLIMLKPTTFKLYVWRYEISMSHWWHLLCLNTIQNLPNNRSSSSSICCCCLVAGYLSPFYLLFLGSWVVLSATLFTLVYSSICFFCLHISTSSKSKLSFFIFLLLLFVVMTIQIVYILGFL